MAKYKASSQEIKSNLFLSRISIDSTTKTTKVTTATNHVFCCDISGSMWNSMEQMRNHLKNRIPDIVNKNDTVTIIAFSGHGRCTTIKELVHVNNIDELQAMNNAIDRYMVANGCTCFYDPVETTVNLISKHSGTYNFIFLSDGGNNDCPWDDVVNILNQLQSKVGSATIIEYGYYADTDKLNQMAETLGGCKINAAQFDSYTPVIEKAFHKKSQSKKVLDISSFKDSMKYAQFVYFSDDQINVISSANMNEILIPESVKDIYCLTTQSLGDNVELADALYAMAYVSAGSLRYQVVEAILSKLGDSKFIDLYCNAYGKQKLFEFQNELQNATFDASLRGESKVGYKPNPKAYCVLDFLTDLKDGDAKIRVVPLYENYNRISVKKSAKAILSESEKKQIASAKTAEDLKKISDNVKGQKVEMTVLDNGYSVNCFVWNEERANLSAMMQIDVNLKLPINSFKIDHIETFIFRNFSIIKDGILNVKVLPLILSEDLFKKLQKKTKLFIEEVKRDSEGVYVNIDISNLPIVNRNYTHSVSCSVMTELALKILESKFALKYLGYLKKAYEAAKPASKKGKTRSEKEIAYLSELGITEKGYSPSTVIEKSDEFYMALTFKSDFNKFSTIPKIDDVKKKLDSGKSLTPSETLMNQTMQKINDECKTEVDVFEKFKLISDEKLKLVEEISKMKFGLILSRKWFCDRNGFEDNHAEIKNSFGDTLTIDYKFSETKQSL